MRNKQKRKANQNPNSGSKKPPFSEREIKDSEKKSTKTESPNNNTQHINCKHPEVIINCNKDTRTKTPFWRKVTFWSAVINFCLLLATYKIWKAGNESARSAQESAATAENTFKEITTEYKNDNEPFVEVGNIALSLDYNQVPSIRYDILNLSKYALKIIEFREGFMISDSATAPVYERDFKPRAIRTLQNVNKYIIKEKPETFILEIKNTFDNALISALKKGTVNIYFSGYLIYQNLITKKKKSYEFVIKLRKPFSKDMNTDYVKNENDSL